jgi:hypothetical protein
METKQTHKEETYNGWSNRETWVFKLHIDNNEGDYNYWQDKARKSQGLAALADELKEWAEEVWDTVLNSDNASHEAKMMVSDVGSLWRVDFHDIAETLKDEQAE